MDPAAPSAHCIWLGQERTKLEPDGAGAEAQDRWKYWSRMVGIDSGSGDSSEVSMGCEAEKRARYQSDARLKSGREHPIAAARAQASEAMAKAEATLGWRPSSPAGGELLMWELLAVLIWRRTGSWSRGDISRRDCKASGQLVTETHNRLERRIMRPYVGREDGPLRQFRR